MFGERKYKVRVDARAAVALTMAITHFSQHADAIDYPLWLWRALNDFVEELTERVEKNERVVISSALAEFMRTEKI